MNPKSNFHKYQFDEDLSDNCYLLEELNSMATTTSDDLLGKTPMEYFKLRAASLIEHFENKHQNKLQYDIYRTEFLDNDIFEELPILRRISKIQVSDDHVIFRMLLMKISINSNSFIDTVAMRPSTFKLTVRKGRQEMIITLKDSELVSARASSGITKTDLNGYTVDFYCPRTEVEIETLNRQLQTK